MCASVIWYIWMGKAMKSPPHTFAYIGNYYMSVVASRVGYVTCTTCYTFQLAAVYFLLSWECSLHFLTGTNKILSHDKNTQSRNKFREARNCLRPDLCIRKFSWGHCAATHLPTAQQQQRGDMARSHGNALLLQRFCVRFGGRHIVSPPRTRFTIMCVCEAGVCACMCAPCRHPRGVGEVRPARQRRQVYCSIWWERMALAHTRALIS